MKAETWWMPIDKNGNLWIRWAWKRRKGVIAELDSQHVSWHERGLRVVKVEITPIRRKVKKARTR